MTRNTAREIAMHLAFELSFTDMPIEEFLEHYLSAEKFAELFLLYRWHGIIRCEL